MADFRELKRGLAIASAVDTGVQGAVSLIEKHLANRARNENERLKQQLWERKALFEYNLDLNKMLLKHGYTIAEINARIKAANENSPAGAKSFGTAKGALSKIKTKEEYLRAAEKGTDGIIKEIYDRRRGKLTKKAERQLSMDYLNHMKNRVNELNTVVDPKEIKYVKTQTENILREMNQEIYGKQFRAFYARQENLPWVVDFYRVIPEWAETGKQAVLDNSAIYYKALAKGTANQQAIATSIREAWEREIRDEFGQLKTSVPPGSFDRNNQPTTPLPISVSIPNVSQAQQGIVQQSSSPTSRTITLMDSLGNRVTKTISSSAYYDPNIMKTWDDFDAENIQNIPVPTFTPSAPGLKIAE